MKDNFERALFVITIFILITVILYQSNELSIAYDDLDRITAKEAECSLNALTPDYYQQNL